MMKITILIVICLTITISMPLMAMTMSLAIFMEIAMTISMIRSAKNSRNVNEDFNGYTAFPTTISISITMPRKYE